MTLQTSYVAVRFESDNLFRTYNDIFRQTWLNTLGEVNTFGATSDLPQKRMQEVKKAVKSAKVFEDDDHTTGTFVIRDRRYIWTIAHFKAKSVRETADRDAHGYRVLWIGLEDDLLQLPVSDT